MLENTGDTTGRLCQQRLYEDPLFRTVVDAFEARVLYREVSALLECREKNCEFTYAGAMSRLLKVRSDVSHLRLLRYRSAMSAASRPEAYPIDELRPGKHNVGD
jgi:hypothetical protein